MFIPITEIAPHIALTQPSAGKLPSALPAVSRREETEREYAANHESYLRTLKRKS